MDEPLDSDAAPRPPTFVQIRPPARPGLVRRALLLAGGGITLIAALGWIAHRTLFDQPVVPVAAQAPPATIASQPSPVPARVDTARAAPVIGADIAMPLWSEETLMDRIVPFDVSARGRPTDPGAPPADAEPANPADASQVSLRLAKGDTIGSALQKLGFETAAIADAISALAPHVKLKSLPVGLALTLQVRRSANDDNKPVLQALTLQPEGRPITVERTDDGQYVVEKSRR